MSTQTVVIPLIGGLPGQKVAVTSVTTSSGQTYSISAELLPLPTATPQN